jgi:SAM-dependent methyltransferase
MHVAVRAPSWIAMRRPAGRELTRMNDAAAERKARTTGRFNRIAPHYDAGGQACFAHFGRRLVDEVGVEPGHRVLDVATGRGAALFPAAERVGAGQVVGIDLAEAMVRTTSEETARRGLTAELRVMDAEQLDFPDATFDRVLCGFGIMFFPHLERALAEIRRVLKLGGQLGVSTWQVSPAQDLREVLVHLGIIGEIGEGLRFPDPAAVVEPLAAAGFVAMRARIDTATFRYDDLDAYWQNARGSVLRWSLDALDDGQVERVKAALTDRVQHQWRADGLHLTATAVLAVASRPE